MISAPYLEVAVLVLGSIILLVEAFASQLDRRFLGYAALLGLAMVFIATFLVAPQSSTASAPLWSFYSADALSLFFKRIALATTAGVLVIMLDFAPSVLIGVQGATPQSGLGEFLTLPLFTCAGLMWMASAIDFVLIFVSLELVTISFYVLVSFTRRNPASLEAGVKYLVLSALATGFLVYGITWIFGATGETNLQ
jgi:NADH-quinone oxidoreductase subunit N